MYLGKADGQLRDDEIMVIIDYLKRQQPEHKDVEEYYVDNPRLRDKILDEVKYLEEWEDLS